MHEVKHTAFFKSLVSLWHICIILTNYNPQHCRQPLKVPRTWIKYHMVWAMPKTLLQKICPRGGLRSVKTKAEPVTMVIRQIISFLLYSCSGKKGLQACINFHWDCPFVIQTKACSSRIIWKMIFKKNFFFFHRGGLNCSFGTEHFVQRNKRYWSLLHRVLTWPMEDESHMAVVYCRSSSGALSFRSNVSTATTTLDTWLGLSEKEKADTVSLEESERCL